MPTNSVPVFAFAAIVFRNKIARKGENVVKEGAVVFAEGVSRLRLFVITRREESFGVEIMLKLNVLPTTLHQIL